MGLLSLLHGKQNSAESRRAAQAMRKRYGDRAVELASEFSTNAADDGDEKARQHWTAVCAELQRISAASQNSIEKRQKSKGDKRSIVKWE